jgi:hypothetical protein
LRRVRAMCSKLFFRSALYQLFSHPLFQKCEISWRVWMGITVYYLS